MNKVAGTVFVMPDEMKKEIELKYKLAALELSKQFYRVVVDHWEPGKLHVRVYRDKDTINPNDYFIRELPNGMMVREETNLRRSQWKIYKKDPNPPSKHKPEPRVAARRRRRPKPGEVKEVNTELSVQVLFVRRAEINDELRKLELKFTRDPQPDHVVKMKELRDQLSEFEMQIVVARLAEGMMNVS